MLGRDRVERFRGILALHRVAFFAFEIYGDLVDQKIERLDAAKAPAFVKAVTAGLELFEDFARLRCELARFNGFLNFGIHGKLNIKGGKVLCHEKTGTVRGTEVFGEMPNMCARDKRANRCRLRLSAFL